MIANSVLDTIGGTPHIRLSFPAGKTVGIRRPQLSLADILANPLIRVDGQADEVGRYTIRLGELRTRIRIENGRPRVELHPLGRDVQLA